MKVIQIRDQYLALIAKGTKTLEIRVGYDHINAISPGERIKLVAQRDEQVIRVREIRRYPNFRKMLQVEDPTRIAPHIPPGELPGALLQVLRDIYPPDREQLGVVVLDIRCL